MLKLEIIREMITFKNAKVNYLRNTSCIQYFVIFYFGLMQKGSITFP